MSAGCEARDPAVEAASAGAAASGMPHDWQIVLSSGLTVPQWVQVTAIYAVPGAGSVAAGAGTRPVSRRGDAFSAAPQLGQNPAAIT